LLTKTSSELERVEEQSMTRRSPCIVVAMLCLLVVAASASAVCGWVLWQEEGPTGSGRCSLDTGMQVAFDTRKDCEQYANARAQFLSAVAKRTSGPTPFLACLPDTVDPRGPKGK